MVYHLTPQTHIIYYLGGCVVAIVVVLCQHHSKWVQRPKTTEYNIMHEGMYSPEFLEHSLDTAVFQLCLCGIMCL